MNDKVLELEEVSRTFSSGVFRTHTVRAVDRVSFALERGKTFGLVGNSGCGKTTTLRILGGFTTPDTGKVIVGGQDISMIPPNKRPLNTVFQKYALFPHKIGRAHV